ncbi:MAG: tetratricopeptide repeat protein, partial [Candidatus Magnetominusculus sp. LBB02]|nr:tetratricopeptide repeat protein [Candidatus Magnetominusculus sp. LBB02]
MDEEIRRSSLGAALKYLDIDDNFNFVRNRLLCRLLPKGAEIVKAIEIAESLKAAKAITIYKEVERSQDIIRHILTVWSDVSDKMFQSKKESSLNEKLLIEAGVFAEMISAIESNDSNRLNLVVLTYGMKPDLRKRIPNIAHLLKAMIDGLRQYVTLKNIPVTADVSYDNEETGLVKEDRILNLILTHGKEMISGKKILAHEAISYVDRQIVTILDQVKQGDEAYAIDTMFNLIKFNVSQGDDEKTQRTLCRLAKDFLNINRTDFAGKCVEYAEAVPRVDAFIGTTKAIILKAKGLLDEALDVYNETIKLFPHDVVARNGKAEVLKELGQLDDALDVYNEAIKLFPHDVVAYCGKAQVLK